MSFWSNSLPPPTPLERARVDAFTVCIPCLINGMFATGWTPEGMDPRIARKARRFVATGMIVENHHTLSGGIRRGHRFTFGNCLWHHRALLLPGFTTSSMTARYGPSLVKGSKPFHDVYGSDDELIAMQDYLIYGDQIPGALMALMPIYRHTAQ